MKENQNNIDFTPKVVNDKAIINDNPWPDFLIEIESEEKSEGK